MPPSSSSPAMEKILKTEPGSYAYCEGRSYQASRG